MTTREKFESISYQDLVSYQDLSDNDKKFFDKLFKILIYNGSINWSNQKLAKTMNETLSTVEKRLKRLEQASLILRESSRQCEFGQWRTVDRVISLNPIYFEFNYKSLTHKIYCDYLFHQYISNVLDKYLEMDYEEFKKVFNKIEVVHND